MPKRPPPPPTPCRLYEATALLSRLEQIEAEHPDKRLWCGYLKRLLRIYARGDGTVDLSLPGMAGLKLPDRIIARDSLLRLAKQLSTNTFTTN